MRWLLVRWSLVSHFYVQIDFSEKEFNWKASYKTIRKWWFYDPSKTYQSLEIVRPNEAHNLNLLGRIGVGFEVRMTKKL